VLGEEIFFFHLFFCVCGVLLYSTFEVRQPFTMSSDPPVHLVGEGEGWVLVLGRHGGDKAKGRILAPYIVPMMSV